MSSRLTRFGPLKVAAEPEVAVGGGLGRCSLQKQTAQDCSQLTTEAARVALAEVATFRAPTSDWRYYEFW
jgi:hypothetical protein